MFLHILGLFFFFIADYTFKTMKCALLGKVTREIPFPNKSLRKQTKLQRTRKTQTLNNLKKKKKKDLVTEVSNVHQNWQCKCSTQSNVICWTINTCPLMQIGKVTHLYLWSHKPPNLFKVQLKATFNILYKMEFVTSSKGKLALFYAARCARKSTWFPQKPFWTWSNH